MVNMVNIDRCTNTIRMSDFPVFVFLFPNTIRWVEFGPLFKHFQKFLMDYSSKTAEALNI